MAHCVVASNDSCQPRHPRLALAAQSRRRGGAHARDEHRLNFPSPSPRRHVLEIGGACRPFRAELPQPDRLSLLGDQAPRRGPR
eukprot:599778-Pyramimonas_sp.AAC.1